MSIFISAFQYRSLASVLILQGRALLGKLFVNRPFQIKILAMIEPFGIHLKIGALLLATDSSFSHSGQNQCNCYDLKKKKELLDTFAN